MSNLCFFDGQGVYYEDESDGKVYVLSPHIMRELTLYGYATKKEVSDYTHHGVHDALFLAESQVHSLESQVVELRNEVKKLQDMVVSYNIQSDDVELAGFFDELDKS